MQPLDRRFFLYRIAVAGLCAGLLLLTIDNIQTHKKLSSRFIEVEKGLARPENKVEEEKDKLNSLHEYSMKNLNESQIPRVIMCVPYSTCESQLADVKQSVRETQQSGTRFILYFFNLTHKQKQELRTLSNNRIRFVEEADIRFVEERNGQIHSVLKSEIGTVGVSFR